jgi:hypothetical protein
MMKKLFSLTSVATITMLFALSSCSTQEEAVKPPPVAPKPAPAAKAEAKAQPPAKVKATKVAGDIGLIDMEKNYMIIVTKEGKLVTVDFDAKTKATQVTPTAGKISDVGLGSSATVSYVQDKGKNIATALEYRPAKGE